MDTKVAEKLRILIVDDQPGALDVLGDIFEDREFLVTRAATGREARAAIQQHEFDVALLDIRLPDAHGTDLLREIRQRSDNTRCIMVTASTDAEDAISALNDGASAYIQKPVHVETVLDTIQDVVAKYRKTVEERRKLRELDVVKNVGEAAMELALQPMLQGVLRAVVDGFHADAGAVFLCRPDSQELRGAAHLNLTDDDFGRWTTRVGEGIVGRVAAQHRPISVEDMKDAQYMVPSVLRDTGLVSVLGAPLSTPEGLVGVLVVGWRSPRAFTGPDLNLLGVCAQRLGIGVVNARLYASEDASRKRAEFLAHVSQELNSHIEDVYQVVIRVTRLATNFLGDGCAVFLRTAGSEYLDAILSYHRVPEKQRFLESHLRTHPIRVGEGNVGRVAQTGMSVLSGRAAVAAYPERSYLTELGIVSALSVPLRARGEIIGVMSCSISESDREFTAADLQLATEFADRAAIAIENARLYAESQEKGQELQSLLEMTRVVTSTLQESNVLESLLRGTSDLIGAPACCIVTYHPESDELEVNARTGIAVGVAENLLAACLSHWRDELTGDATPFVIDDLLASSREDVASAARAGGFRSMLALPFSVEGPDEGLLVALTHEPDLSLSHRAELLSTLGGLAGVAISNARSYKRELKIAERLQQWILSTESDVDLAKLEIGRDYHAALNEATVGGDFFDIFTVGPDQLGVVIGDVSGKGLEAALHTQAVKHTMRAYALNAGLHAASSSSPGAVLMQTNDAMGAMLPPDVFITLFYGVVDLQNCTMRYTNAGHDAPILRRADGTMETLQSTGRVLGMMPDAAYEEHLCQLAPGDMLLLYTDGVTEARRDGEFLELEGVMRLLDAHADEPAQDVVRGIYRDVQEYSRGAIHDDIALMLLRVPPLCAAA